MTGRLEGNVLITGGSGFLGRAIIRRAKRERWPVHFTVYSRDETKQWELRHRFPDVSCLLGDVSRDIDRLIAACAGHDTVIHAAAVKYIPEAEHNVFETVDVNIIGSRNVAMAAIAAGVKTVVGVSTDKACSPLNVYGMTKGVMERIFSEANRLSYHSQTKFITVRYGNVIGSTGSVIPVFFQQIKDYGELRVTSPDMTRFWLSADEAVDLICRAVDYAASDPGYTLIDACPAMKIPDLAKAVWANRFGEDSEPKLCFTGLRPGEKLSESLYNEQERTRAMPVDGGFMLQPATMTPTNRAWDKKALPDHYSSDAPRAWLSITEMNAFIEDAKTV